MTSSNGRHSGAESRAPSPEPRALDGALILDKPKGITSHDAVAAARRLLSEKRIGHGGTLDPLATGVLVLLCGRATRLSRFIMASDKTYEARIVFGVTTDTYDITGTITSRSSSRPALADVEQALSTLRGSYLQEPPAFSAKKVQGRRAYDMARRNEAVELRAVPVTVSHLGVTSFDGTSLTVVLTCSAGFYVRSFAHTLGQLAGPGACLEELRRTRSGDFSIDDAVGLEDGVSRESLERRVIPMEGLLRSLPARVVTPEGRQWVMHGRALTPSQLTDGDVSPGGILPSSAGGRPDAPAGAPGTWVRLLDQEGRLVALGQITDAALHPSIVLI